MAGETATIHSIQRYPVKGLSAETVARVALTKGGTLPFDRAYAIENGASGFDPLDPKYFPKIRFLELMKNECLAELRTTFDDTSGVLVIRRGNREAAQGDLRTAEGREAIERFFAAFCPDELRGPPKLLHADGHSFSDVSKKVVSIINLASVAAIENVVNAAVDPIRFRGNLHVVGWPAWQEFDLLGSVISIGPSARLKIVKRIVRCAATEVDPTTAMRDLPIPHVLMATYGHADCGVYGEVVAAGDVAVGDGVSVNP